MESCGIVSELLLGSGCHPGVYISVTWKPAVFPEHCVEAYNSCDGGAALWTNLASLPAGICEAHPGHYDRWWTYEIRLHQVVFVGAVVVATISGPMRGE
jgi:hypothetical protein